MISPLGTAGGLQLTSMTVMLIILTEISLGGEGAGEWRVSEWISIYTKLQQHYTPGGKVVMVRVEEKILVL